MTAEEFNNMSEQELMDEIRKGCLNLTDIIDRNYIKAGEYLKESSKETWYDVMCKLFTQDGVKCRGSFGNTEYSTVAFVYECLPYVYEEDDCWVEKSRFDVSRWRDIANIRDGKRFALFAGCNYFDHSATGWRTKYGAIIFLGICEINKSETLKRGQIIWTKVEPKLHIDQINSFTCRRLFNDTFEESEVYQQALNGNTDSQNIVGNTYLYGIGVPHDFHRAIYWLEKAANQKHAGASYTIGALYEEKFSLCNSIGSEDEASDNIQKAIYYLEIAAASKHASAIRVLGDMHRLGYGYKKNEYKALQLYEESAALGDENAAEKVQAWKFEIEYRHLFIERAEKGNANAQFVLAEKYFNADDEFFWEDDEKAFYWYQKAAEQNHSKSQGMLGVCYVKGLGVAEDHEKGMSWLMRAADNDNNKAMAIAARMLLRDENSEEQKSKAVEY